jgi:hypothetical protein
VQRLLDNARRLFDTAAAAPEDGATAILFGADGCLRMFCDSDWTPEALEREHGAREAYVITRRSGSVRVEGRIGPDRCVMQSESTAAVARRLLSAVPSCFLIEPRALIAG